MRRSVLALVLALGACVSVDVHETRSASSDATLTAIMNARASACPAASVAPNARTSGETTRVGVTETVLTTIPLTGEPAGRVLRLRRLTVAPNGVLPWHDHAARQGMDLLVSGEMVEYRNSCRDPIRHRAGDIIGEGAEVAHWWRNESRADAVILVTDVLPPP